MGTGWVLGGLYRVQGSTTHPPREEDPYPAKRARKALQGAWSGGVWVWARDPAAVSQDPPFGPGRSPLVPSLVLGPLIAASWPITARFHHISYKVSQNGQVSPKYVEKASHSPCFQNVVRKSPLEILRFPYFLAFSHKELMGRFDPHP